MKDLYDISKLNIDKVQNADVKELYSIYIVNPKIKEILNIEGLNGYNIKKNNSDKIKKIIIDNFFK